VNSRPDDDALSWDGDDDPTLDVGVEAPRSSRVEPRAEAAPATPRVREPRRKVDDDEDDDDAPAGLGNVALVSLGLIAGAYVFFAIGWFIAGLRLQALGGLPVSAVMLVAATFATAAAPLIWFATAFALTRHARTWVRFAWLVAGIVLLVPWPFLFTGAI
jgi:hypothetical protein